MKYLIAVSSKHGSTREVGQFISEKLLQEGHEVEIVPPDELNERLEADGLILGSAVYMGGWMKEFVKALPVAEKLNQKMPVWVFSVGPLGDPLMPKGDPDRVKALLDSLGRWPDFREHRVFGGKLDSTLLSTGEKLILKMVKASAGDFRPWAEIEEWAKRIALSTPK